MVAYNNANTSPLNEVCLYFVPSLHSRLSLLTRQPATMPRLVYLIIGCLAFNSFEANAFSAGRSVTSTYAKAPSSSTCLAVTRRSWLQDASKNLAITTAGASSVLMLDVSSASAREITDIASGNLPDLPPEAQRSYLQYRKSFPFDNSCSCKIVCVVFGVSEKRSDTTTASWS